MFSRTILTIILCASVVLSGGEADEALFTAARNGDSSAITAALEGGADVNARNRYEATPLFYAAGNGHINAVKLLLASGADVNVKDSFYEATPLSWAAYNGHTAIVKMLIASGADDGDEALTTAISLGDTAMVRTVLESGDLDAETLGKALLSVQNGSQPEIAAMLEAAGAVLPQLPQIDVPVATLQSYTGTYRNAARGFQMIFTLAEGKLHGAFEGQQALSYRSTSQTTFTSVEFAGVDIAFQLTDGVVSGFQLTQGTFSADFSKASTTDSTETAKPVEPVAGAEITASSAPEHGSAFDGNWPSFRGRYAAGVADGAHPPTRWDAESGDHLRWKTAIPGFSHASPLVWGDQIFILTAVSSDTSAEVRVGLYGDVAPDGDVSPHSWQVMALDARNGAMQWTQTAIQGAPKVKRHTKATQANATPATDGKYLVALFGAEGLYCYNTRGKLIWKKDLGMLDAGWFYDPDYQWGHGSSPVIYHDMVIVQCDRQKDSFIAAYRLKDGREVWRVARDEIPSWSTPTVYEFATGAELITNGTNAIRGYRPADGSVLWTLSGNSEIAVPTPIIAHQHIFVTSGYRPIQPIYAIRPGSRGDISTADDSTDNAYISWSKQRGGPYMPTPIIYGDHLYVCANNGTLTCYDAHSGEQVYRQRLGGRGGGYAFSASPVAADGRIYFTSEDGIVYVVAAGEQYRLISQNEIGEVCMATPAITNGMLVVRAQSHVYGFGK